MSRLTLNFNLVLLYNSEEKRYKKNRQSHVLMREKCQIMEIHVRKLVSQIKVVNHHLNLAYATRINRKNIKFISLSLIIRANWIRLTNKIMMNTEISILISIFVFLLAIFFFLFAYYASVECRLKCRKYEIGRNGIFHGWQITHRKWNHSVNMKSIQNIVDSTDFCFSLSRRAEMESKLRVKSLDYLITFFNIS